MIERIQFELINKGSDGASNGHKGHMPNHILIILKHYNCITKNNVYVRSEM